jgi:hypothetical protein
MKFPKFLKVGCLTLVLLMGTTVIKMPIAGANPVATSPVNKEPPGSQLSSAPNGPWVGAIQRLVGLQELPVHPVVQEGYPPEAMLGSGSVPMVSSVWWQNTLSKMYSHADWRRWWSSAHCGGGLRLLPGRCWLRVGSGPQIQPR